MSEVLLNQAAYFVQRGDLLRAEAVYREVLKHDPRNFEAHDALLCIAEGRLLSEQERRRVTGEHWFKPADKMRELFADLPEACDNTLLIAERCNVKIELGRILLPSFPTPDGRDAFEYLVELCEAGLRRERLTRGNYAPSRDDGNATPLRGLASRSFQTGHGIKDDTLRPRPETRPEGDADRLGAEQDPPDAGVERHPCGAGDDPQGRPPDPGGGAVLT